MMTGSKINNKRNGENSYRLIIFSLIILHVIFLYIAGYFEIGLISDDYLNFISAESSSLFDKFHSSIPYYSNYHFRPLWFLSVEFSIYVNGLLHLSKENFILFRIENLIYFYTFALLAAFLLKKLTGNNFLSIILFLACIIYPCNLNGICWTAGRVDLLCGIFILSSLIFCFRYFRSGSFTSLVISSVFMLRSLCTKETSVIIPFVTFLIFFISYGKAAFGKIKYLLLSEFILLLIYCVFKIFYIGNSPSDILTIYGAPGLFNRAGVIVRAIVSLTVPYDYLSLQYSISSLDITFFIYVLVLIITGAAIFILLKREYKLKYLSLVFIVFLFTVFPNLIAGYFRPQLILIPFVLTFLALLIVISKTDTYKLPVKIFPVIILAFWTFLSFNLIKEWNYAYRESLKGIEELCKADIDFISSKKAFVIGLPSRYRQSSMLDYASGPFNYWCLDGFKIENEITDIIHTGALDENSLNSKIKVNILNRNEFDISVTGKTQYLLKLDSPESEFRDNETEIFFSEFNSFGKPTKAIIKFFKDDNEIFIFSNGKIAKAGI